VARPVLDTRVAAETPEGILLELRPAGMPARACAFLLDSGIRLLIFYAVALVSALLGQLAPALYLILAFLLEWLYPVAFELSPGGATPGKRVLGLTVMMDNGLPITPAASLSRNLLRVADFLPFLYAFGIVSVLLRKDFKRLGDLAAATLVVYRPAADRHTVLAEAPPVPPAIPVSSQDQAAVIALAARAPRLTPERLDELAGLASALTGEPGSAGPEVTRRVLGAAQWFLGRR